MSREEKYQSIFEHYEKILTIIKLRYPHIIKEIADGPTKPNQHQTIDDTNSKVLPNNRGDTIF